VVDDPDLPAAAGVAMSAMVTEMAIIGGGQAGVPLPRAHAEADRPVVCSSASTSAGVA
jgi:hypothetical protein